VIYFEKYGIAEMMWYLTRLDVLKFCRLSTELPTGSTCGPPFYPRIDEGIWIVDALS
jgi:hypothetical protein